jgi:hypothetical protein
MLATFCLRLAFGLAASLLLFRTREVNPRFYRIHFTTILALLVATTIVDGSDASGISRFLLLAAIALAFISSIIWSLPGTPGGIVLAILTVFACAGALACSARPVSPAETWSWRLADDFSSATLLGIATTAMLMGHSYLIAPAMSLTPLLNLLIALFVVTALRMLLSALAIWSWTAAHSLSSLEIDVMLWMPLRWTLGLLGPLALCVMAWNSARIRSTQSATGILYVVVIFCFVGELTSQLLLSATGRLI